MSKKRSEYVGDFLTIDYEVPLRQKIADLEAKLAESEENLKEELADKARLERAISVCNHQNDKFADMIKKLVSEKEELKQQLAEMTEKYNACQEARKLESEFSQQDKKELIQQLAEKEEEIKQLNNRILFSQLQAPKEQILNIVGSQCVQYNPDQDKISFAVKQLEKVKEEIGNEIDTFIDSYGDRCIDESDLVFFIDNQIKKLKGK